MPTNYPTEFKVKAIRRYEKGESIKALSQELHVVQSTLYQWRNTYCSIQAPNRTYTPAEFDMISRWLQRLEHETQIVRFTGFLEKIPLQEKLAALEQIYNQTDGQYSVHELCSALCVARGTFITIFSAVQIRLNMKTNKTSFHLRSNRSLMTANNDLVLKKFAPSLPRTESMSAKIVLSQLCRNRTCTVSG